MGFGCLVLGGGTLVNWWFEMFSDCGYAQLCRSIMSQGGFYLGRNTIALIEPAVGSMFAFGGALLLVETSGSEISLPEAFFGGGLFLSMLLFAVGLIPFRLPAPMYPEWQLERRRRRAQEAARAGWEHEAGSIVPRGRHAAPPETVNGAGCRYGQYAGDAGGEDPLRSTDSLPMRARSPHDDDSGPSDGENV